MPITECIGTHHFIGEDKGHRGLPKGTQPPAAAPGQDSDPLAYNSVFFLTCTTEGEKLIF